MKKIFLEAPNLKKGRKIVSVIMADNKGDIVYTNWSYKNDNESLDKQIKEIKKLRKELNKI